MARGDCSLRVFYLLLLIRAFPVVGVNMEFAPTTGPGFAGVPSVFVVGTGRDLSLQQKPTAARPFNP